MEDLLEEIRAQACAEYSRFKRARYIAALIKVSGQYRWVGIYDVGQDLVSVVAWSGPGAPAYPTFPVTQGLTSAAIKSRSTVRVNDVSIDTRYLTAFGSTRSEIIIPVLAPTDGRVIGTIDVEGGEVNAFSEKDERMLQQCAGAALPLWLPERT